MYETITPLDGVTATTTSEAIDISDAKKVIFHFVRADHSSGSSEFEVLASVDGTNYSSTGLMLVSNVADSNSESLTRELSTTLSSDTDVIRYLNQFATAKYIKVKVTETSDGTHTARVGIQY